MAAKMRGQPLLEQRGHRVRQPQHDIPRRPRAGLGGGLDERRNFMLGQPGNHGSEQDADWNSGLG